MRSWFVTDNHPHFSIHNLPYCVFSLEGSGISVGIGIGDSIIDLRKLAELGGFDTLGTSTKYVSIFGADCLNPLMEMGRDHAKRVRVLLQEMLQNEQSLLASNRDTLLIKQDRVVFHMPVHVGDVSAFYSSIHHARNMGKMIRPNSEPLLPNWRHLPVALGARAGSLMLSGVPIKRPWGQTLVAGQDSPIFGPSRWLDFELELGFLLCKSTSQGERINIEDAESAIFGTVLINDWSARDIQKWEYQPLGPFLAKNFGTSIGTWVVTMDALEPFRIPGEQQEPDPLPHLRQAGPRGFQIDFEIAIATEGGGETVISRPSFANMYWSMAQQLAHQTSNGCPVRVGDLMYSGTISGEDSSAYGCLIELSWNGSRPLTLSDGTKRTVLEDEDTVIFRGFATKGDITVGFGELSTCVLPADHLG